MAKKSRGIPPYDHFPYFNVCISHSLHDPLCSRATGGGKRAKNIFNVQAFRFQLIAVPVYFDRHFTTGRIYLLLLL